MVVMSNGAGPSALRIVIPTTAKMVKKTNLQDINILSFIFLWRIGNMVKVQPLFCGNKDQNKVKDHS